jgi:hypothetical protein
MTSAISSATASFAASIRPESAEPAGKDMKNDHDKDDVGGATTAIPAASTPKPTVNTQGQQIGTVLNAKA